jgi:IS605 OrfB family transposase
MPYLYPKLKELLGKYKLCDPLIFERGGDIWIAMTFDVPETLPTRTLALGIDLGCRVVAATSEGNLYLDKVFNAQRRRLRYLKRCLQAKAMKRSRTAAKHLKKLKRKETNKNKNFVHHLTNKILKDTKADTLILENLKSIKVKRNKYQNKNRISQVPFYMIKQFLTYKAHLLNRQVETVSPAWTSQTDAVTGKRDGTRKGRRYYSKSGMIYDADINASCVIAHRSKLPVSQKLLTYGQATVNTPIVSNRGDKLPTFSR